MSSPALLLVAYDARQAASRHRLRQSVQHHAVGHQRSLYEQFPEAGEQKTLVRLLQARKEASDDLWIFVIDPRAQKIFLGCATTPHQFSGAILS